MANPPFDVPGLKAKFPELREAEPSPITKVFQENADDCVWSTAGLYLIRSGSTPEQAAAHILSRLLPGVRDLQTALSEAVSLKPPPPISFCVGCPNLKENTKL